MSAYFSTTDDNDLKRNADKFVYYLSYITNFANEPCAKIAVAMKKTINTNYSYKGMDGKIQSFQKEEEVDFIGYYKCKIDNYVYEREYNPFLFARINHLKEELKKKEEEKSLKNNNHYFGEYDLPFEKVKNEYIRKDNGEIPPAYADWDDWERYYDAQKLVDNTSNKKSSDLFAPKGYTNDDFNLFVLSIFKLPRLKNSVLTSLINLEQLSAKNLNKIVDEAMPIISSTFRSQFHGGDYADLVDFLEDLVRNIDNKGSILEGLRSTKELQKRITKQYGII